MAIITLETDEGSVTMDAVLEDHEVTRHGQVAGGLLTTVREVWRDVNGQAWEYTEDFIQPPMQSIGFR